MKRHKLAGRPAEGPADGSVVRWGEGLVARAKNASLGVGLIARGGKGRRSEEVCEGLLYWKGI